VVIGAGAGGLVTAYIAAAVKARVTLVEQHRMGGDCLNTGCVPSKALIRTATLLAQLRRSQDFGIRAAPAAVDFPQVMERVQRVVRTVAPHDSAERYRGLGVEVVAGRARIVSPWAVEITGEDGAVQHLATRGIVIATGARPFVPPIPGLEAVGYLTSDNLWDLRTLPRRLVVLGGGPIGAELAQAFARLGSQVTQVEMLPRLLMREDPEVSDLIAARFRAEGIEVLVEHQAKRFLVEGGEKILVAEHAGADRRIPFDAVLVAVGRGGEPDRVTDWRNWASPRAALSRPTPISRPAIPTSTPSATWPDLINSPTPAAHQAWYAAVNALFSGFKRFKADYRVIPWVTFTSPEVARVGLSEAEAQAQGIAYEVTRYGLDDLDRAIADSDAHGFVKVLTPPGKGPHPGGDHRRRARRRAVGGIHPGHEVRTGAQQDPRHHPPLSHLERGR
jgi:pyruvate/2-oxoglutarate dehydrogenase complex dihydrolipoamide dehydrogenase (E3) component